MELLYLWIENYKCIKNQGFNFSPRYKFTFTQRNYKNQLGNILEGELIKEDLTPTTDDNFFGEHITNITAIVGKNGTGKSTLINSLFAFSKQNDYKGQRILIFINNESELFLYVPCDPQKANIIRNFKCEIKFIHNSASPNENLKNTSFIYLNHSIHISNFGKMGMGMPNNNDRSIDLSSLYIFEKNNGFDKANNIEIYQQFNVLLNTNDVMNIQINTPSVLEISINIPNMETIHDDIIAFFDNQFIEGDSHLFFKAFLFMSVFYLLFDHKGLDKKITQDAFLKFKKDEPITEWVFLLLDEIENQIKQQNSRVQHQVKRIKYIKEFLNAILHFDQYISENKIKIEKKHGGSSLENKFSSGSFAINLKNDGDYDKRLIGALYKLFRYTNKYETDYAKDIFPNRYIKLSWWNFSSGEQVMLNTFCRLYHIKDKVIDNQIILLIDEGELYLHPEWQRRYINDLIDLLKKAFKGKKVQIILTSHSPFIISDLPKEHVIFLNKDTQGYCQVVPGLEKHQTFGANIHTLFAEAFFLEDGLIGDFAKHKINDVIKNLKNNPNQEQIYQANKLIELIGEPVLRRKMQQLLDDAQNNSNQLG